MIQQKIDWQACLEPIVRKAGDILLSYYGKQLIRQEKPRHGFVTEADHASEQYLIENLAKVLPEASFFAEESGKSGSGEYCWVIDPLDGTTNFAHGLPYFCISVALTHKDIPIVGIIFQPLSNEVFFAQSGKGAFLNGDKINVSAPVGFDKSLIALGLPYAKSKSVPLIHAAESVIKQAYAFRHLGAIALDLAYVAAGHLDGVFFTHLAWWDVAAGMLLIQEAGGMISDFTGNALNPAYNSCIAGGLQVYETLQSLLRDKG